jgi:hypothetical protein
VLLEEERALLARDVAEMRKLIQEVAPGVASVGGATAGSTTTKESAALDDRDFSRLEHEARQRAVDERLEELKRRMRG